LIGIAGIYFELDKQDFTLKNLQSAQLKGELNYDGKILLLKSAILSQNLPQARIAYNSITENTNEKLLLGSLINILAQDLIEAENKLKLIVTNNINDQHFLVAKELLQSINIYKTFIDSPYAYLYALSAKTLLDQNQFILARPLLFASIENQNDYRDAWLMLGYSYILVNKNDDAIKALNRAKQIDPYNPETFFYLGLAQQKSNKTSQSIENLQRANSFGFRSSKDNLVQIANSFYLEKKYTEALDFYNQATSEGSLSIEDYTKMIWINLEHTNSLQEALNIAQKALNEYPTTPMANNLVAWSYIGLNNYSEAKKYLEIALLQNPNFEAAYLNLGLVAVANQNTDEALTNFNKAIELAEQNRAPSIAERAKSEIQKLNNQQ
jgi:tetratricopeptide (TPR) repeat protein